jgi:hypothetical protein
MAWSARARARTSARTGARPRVAGVRSSLVTAGYRIAAALVPP